jgi:uncharacterized C2H2 Zn-finger protein
MNDNIKGNIGEKPTAVCPICWATFKDGRGLNGHMAGKHGCKYGINATVDSLIKEVRDLGTKIDIVVEMINKIDAAGQKPDELCSKPIQAPHSYERHVNGETKRKIAELKGTGSELSVEGTQLTLE